MELKLYENSLIITEAGPFVDYIFSINDMHRDRQIVHESEREALLQFISEKIRSAKAITIPCDSGMFICGK